MALWHTAAHVVLPAYLGFLALAIWGFSRMPKPSAIEQAAEDDAQMAFNREWQAKRDRRAQHIAHQRAMLRGDKRALPATRKVLDQAMASRLRAEMGR